ncbi:hypothetical protein AQUCO_00900112v1 [Aquilegia coerulea]|uniref:Uncharacterized protein n=1 Tax=Aquilegia coerulea TaxID=218851 RepID=A0A2G5EC78_AQUCA|nr:hypothetical protein AQUCO_00900112v1 [Aquilegia coerulea]
MIWKAVAQKVPAIKLKLHKSQHFALSDVVERKDVDITSVVQACFVRIELAPAIKSELLCGSSLLNLEKRRSMSVPCSKHYEN